MSQEIDCRHFPFMEKGRWYQIFCESDSNNVEKITSTDLSGIELDNGFIICPANFRIIDYKIDFNPKSVDTMTGLPVEIYAVPEHKQSMSIPTPDMYSDMYVYVFGYFK